MGYVASRDRYQKRDELGAVFQLCVDPLAQRKFVGASLLKAVFDRASYGCRLFCCWCAQDIAANNFWEAMGFVPLAYRAGGKVRTSSRSTQPSALSTSARVHIFWQKRIRLDDVTTPWWFPSKTEGGSIREDRIVLPIPAGTHWSDAKPLILPALSNVEGPALSEVDEPTDGVAHSPEEKVKSLPAPPRNVKKASPAKVHGLAVGRLRFGPAPAAKTARVKPPKEKKPKAKADPRLIQAARELRDRWLEQANDTPMIAAGKYDLVRTTLPDRSSSVEVPRLAA